MRQGRDRSTYEEVAKGRRFSRSSTRSNVGTEIPAYLFQPLQKRGAKGHAELIWVHGGGRRLGAHDGPFVKRRSRLRRDFTITAAAPLRPRHYLKMTTGYEVAT